MPSHDVKGRVVLRRCITENHGMIGRLMIPSALFDPGTSALFKTTVRTLEDAPLKLCEERKVALAILVPGHRRLEITSIGQAIGTFIEVLEGRV